MRNYRLNGNAVKKLSLMFIVVIGLVFTSFKIIKYSITQLEYFPSNSTTSSDTDPLGLTNHDLLDEEEYFKELNELQKELNLFERDYQIYVQALSTDASLDHKLALERLKGIHQKLIYNMGWMEDDKLAYTEDDMSIEELSKSLALGSKRQQSLIKMAQHLMN